MSLDVKAWILLIGMFSVQVTTSAATAKCPEYLHFLGSKCAQWQAAVLPESLPAAKGNAVADSDAAAALGMKIFYDNRFSLSGSGVACVSCHEPEHAFAEQEPTSHTIRRTTRNAPDLIDAAWYARAHFWDGKVDNLWSAPLFTFEQEDEMGSSRLQVVHTLASIYKIRYEQIFGPLPNLGDTQRFPQTGKPGTPQFEAMSEDDKNLVNQAYANVGKALEAYVRKLAAGRSQFDDFMSGSAKSLSIDAQRGMIAFTRLGCDSCHYGATFTDERFHSVGNLTDRQAPIEAAHAGGMAFAKSWMFTSKSKFADQPSDELPGDTPSSNATADADLTGFRTPTLRNVALTSPYGHDGRWVTLEQAIDAHARVLPDKKPPNAQDMHDLIALLRSLGGSPPRPPWNYWPGG